MLASSQKQDVIEDHTFIKMKQQLDTFFRINGSMKVFIAGLALLALGGIPLLSMDKTELALLINAHWSPVQDAFFQKFTHLGLGALMALLAVIFLFIRYYFSVLLAAGLLSAGITTYLCKQLFFSELYRPAKAIGMDHFHHIIHGFDYSSFGSFPSGHTFTTFSTALILAIYSRHRMMGLVLLVVAALVGFSRMYLMQHFFIDVYAGALLGTLITLLLHYWLGFRVGWYNSSTKNSNLISLYKKRRSQVDKKQA